MKTSFMMTSSAATIYIDGQKFIFTKDHPNFPRAVAAVKAKRWDLIPNLLNLRTAIKQVSEKVELAEDGTFFYDGTPIPGGYLLDRLSKMDDPTPLARFLDRYAANPSPISKEEAVEFFNKAQLPLTPEGFFYAWKVVRDDYTDKHTGKFDNSVGKVLEMERSKVDGNRHNLCSSGFHVCSRSYIPSFANQNGTDRLMKVVVDPADIVSIPADHDAAKMRVCRYKVVAEEKFGNEVRFEQAGVRSNPDDLTEYKFDPQPQPLPPKPKDGWFRRFLRHLDIIQ